MSGPGRLQLWRAQHISAIRIEAHRWRQAKSLDDLGELTAQWLEGCVESQPGYAPGRGPDEETVPHVPVLAAANRAGFMTNGSQPGVPLERGYDGAMREQRAAVKGFATEDVTRRLWRAAEAAGLAVVAYDPANLPRRRFRWGGRMPVTRRAGADCTWFGTQLPRRSLRDTHEGYGTCHRNAVGALCRAWQITIADPEWGRNDRLWPALERFAK